MCPQIGIFFDLCLKVLPEDRNASDKPEKKVTVSGLIERNTDSFGKEQ